MGSTAPARGCRRRTSHRSDVGARGLTRPADARHPRIRVAWGRSGTLLDVHVTERTDHAVRAMIELVTASADDPVSAEALGDRQRIPMEALRNVLADLQREQLVTSRHHPGGGYWLTRPADEVSIADVIRAIDGPLA